MGPADHVCSPVGTGLASNTTAQSAVWFLAISSRDASVYHLQRQSRGSLAAHWQAERSEHRTSGVSRGRGKMPRQNQAVSTIVRSTKLPRTVLFQ
jgi:hypothetical protein